MLRSFILLVIVSPFALAEDKKPVGTVKPEGTALEISISGEAKYPLEIGGLTPEEFAKNLAISENTGRRPGPPKVALKITVTNTGRETIEIHKGGDSVVLDLVLKGKGAVSLKPNLAFTQEFRSPVAVKLEAGKSLTFPLTTLSSGFRGASEFHYWTAAGDYELTAIWKTGVSPAPKGSEINEGFGTVTLTSAPFKISVEEKK